MAQLIYQETATYEVPLAVIKGMSSKTFLWDSAEAIDAADKGTYLYFLGDHDGAGDDIIASAVKRIRHYADTGHDIYWQKLAVTPKQITEFNLPLRPAKTKKEEDDLKFQAGCVELDALPPDELLRIVREAIEEHIDHKALKILQTAECNERELMARIAGNLPDIRRYLDGGIEAG
ncbi:MAG: hypothetical protein JOZ70_09350 [Pseudolabrys sp.]|nr:hypothetical protein [Pseudolabrys sp.]